LYGSDQSQFLLVVKNKQDVYQVLYLNRRGAGDVMVRLDEVKSTEANDTEFEIVAQMDAQDIPRIRRFVNDLPAGQNVVGFVTSQKTGSLSAIERGDQLISTLSAGLGDRLKTKVRFINLADLGLVSLGVNRISFVYVRP
jgi:CRISPR/Cas system-associated endonuclease Cas1